MQVSIRRSIILAGIVLFVVCFSASAFAADTRYKLPRDRAVGELEIVKPEADDDFDLTESDYTRTSKIVFEGKVSPNPPTQSIDWYIVLEYKTSGGRYCGTEYRRFELPSGAQREEEYEWGGKITANAQATIAGVVINEDPVCFTVTGVSIPDATITEKLRAVYSGGATPNLLTGIADKESDYRQFRELTLYHKQDKWPNESWDGGSHIGLMMVPLRMADAWNWKTNVDTGRAIFLQKLGASQRHVARLQALYPELRDLTGEEHENNALLIYGPHGDTDGDGMETNEWYYVPNTTHTDWLRNATGNPQGIAYADDCRSRIRH